MTDATAAGGEHADRLGAVVSAWLDDHHGEPVRIERADVQEIVYRLIQAHLHPTVENVRRVNGGKGSPNVIHPAIRDFFMSGELERRWNAPRAIEGVPEPLVSLWGQLVDQARQDLRHEFEADAEKAIAAKADLVNRAKDLDARDRAINERVHLQDALVRRLEKEAESAKEYAARARQACELERTEAIARIDAAVAAREAAQRERHNQREVVMGLEQQLAVAVTAYEHLQATQRAMVQELMEARKQLQHVNSKCDDALQRIRESERAHRVETAALNTTYDEALAQLQSALDASRERVAEVVAERDTAKGELVRADAALIASTEQINVLRKFLELREAKVETLEASLHKVLRHVRKQKGAGK